MSAYRAPSGGMVSRVTGRWYNGGEFMPEHGLFAGKSGKRRAATWERHAAAGRAVDLGGQGLYELRVWCRGSWLIVGVAIAADGPAAAAAFQPKYRERVDWRAV